ncbi:LysM domain-containing protein [Nitrosospira sp. Nl5]|uniref:CIS tube protein n=1 Tax=Nitrosospira sp. Nl5 TaxID=200120 RepID=UPI0008843764|nr:LysM peptidoglycan-binding domain-containing protein [Nitrosospira sp. Nl5]SCX85765.1 LysM domain-containing protein [Nitrosospira sp. Nl5]
MALEQMKILVELAGSTLQFDEKNSEGLIVAKFNPNRLTVSRSVQWQSQKVAKRDCPESQYTGSEPATLSVELFFDTYDDPEKNKKSVREYTNKLHYLTTVKKHGDKHRPPVCRLIWGTMSVFFQGVLQQLQNQFTLFMEDGTPVRATATCTFRQWQSNISDLKEQDLMSADVAKVWVVKRGQTLASIAAKEYGDPRKWRPIAQANGIDDPVNLHPGAILALPALRNI